MNILITGGAGYIGSVLVEVLLNSTDHNVRVVDNLLYQQAPFGSEFRNTRFEFYKGDVRSEDVMVSHEKWADIIIPLAALVGAPICAAEPEAAEAINKTSVIAMFKRLSTHQIVIMPTTNSAYGIGETDGYCDELSELRPISQYARDKVDVEAALLERENSVSFRLATVFGMSRRMRLDLLVNDFVYRAATDKFIVLFEPHFRRNFIHVDDVVKLFVWALSDFEIFKSEVFNVGLSSANLNKMQLCEEIKKQFPDFNFFVSDFNKDPDQRDYLVSNKKLENIGWLPKVSLQAGISELKHGLTTIRKRGFSNV